MMINYYHQSQRGLVEQQRNHHYHHHHHRQRHGQQRQQQHKSLLQLPQQQVPVLLMMMVVVFLSSPISIITTVYGQQISQQEWIAQQLLLQNTGGGSSMTTTTTTTNNDLLRQISLTRAPSNNNNDGSTSSTLVPCSVCDSGEIMIKPTTVIKGGTVDFIYTDLTCLEIERIGQNSEFTAQQCVSIRKSIIPLACNCFDPPLFPVTPTATTPTAVITPSPNIFIPVTTAPVSTPITITTNAPVSAPITLPPVITTASPTTSKPTIGSTTIQPTMQQTAPPLLPVPDLNGYYIIKGYIMIRLFSVQEKMPEESTTITYENQLSIFYNQYLNAFNVQPGPVLNVTSILQNQSLIGKVPPSESRSGTKKASRNKFNTNNEWRRRNLRSNTNNYYYNNNDDNNNNNMIRMLQTTTTTTTTATNASLYPLDTFMEITGYVPPDSILINDTENLFQKQLVQVLLTNQVVFIQKLKTTAGLLDPFYFSTVSRLIASDPTLPAIPTPAPIPTSPNGDDNKLSTGGIIGIVIGATIFLSILYAIIKHVYCNVDRRNNEHRVSQHAKKQQQQQNQDQQQQQQHPNDDDNDKEPSTRLLDERELQEPQDFSTIDAMGGGDSVANNAIAGGNSSNSGTPGGGAKVLPIPIVPPPTVNRDNSKKILDNFRNSTSTSLLKKSPPPTTTPAVVSAEDPLTMSMSNTSNINNMDDSQKALDSFRKSKIQPTPIAGASQSAGEDTDGIGGSAGGSTSGYITTSASGGGGATAAILRASSSGGNNVTGGGVGGGTGIATSTMIQSIRSADSAAGGGVVGSNNDVAFEQGSGNAATSGLNKGSSHVAGVSVRVKPKMTQNLPVVNIPSPYSSETTTPVMTTSNQAQESLSKQSVISEISDGAVVPEDPPGFGSRYGNIPDTASVASTGEYDNFSLTQQQQFIGDAALDDRDAASYAYSLDANTEDGASRTYVTGGTGASGAGSVDGSSFGGARPPIAAVSLTSLVAGSAAVAPKKKKTSTSKSDSEDDDDEEDQEIDRLFHNQKNMVNRIVIAPAGKLGIVIDTTIEGPVVHKVFANSPLEGSLFVGDIIVAIDDVDTRAMSASAITDLMVRTANQPRRLTVLSIDNIG